jgi:hypothetical protein
MGSLASIEELGSFLQQSLVDFQTEADLALGLSSAAVRSHCRRTFDYVEGDTISLPWRARVFLPNPPVLAIDEVTLDDVAVTYELDGSGGMWIDGSSGSTVSITYAHGFATIPDDVRLVVLRLATRIFKNPTGRVSFNADNLNYAGATDVSPRILTGDEMAILRRWRLHRIGATA